MDNCNSQRTGFLGTTRSDSDNREISLRQEFVLERSLVFLDISRVTRRSQRQITGNNADGRQRHYFSISDSANGPKMGVSAPFADGSKII